jgi:hypothetical protein
MPPKHPSRKPRLSVAQLEIVGQFSDYAFDYPNLNFEDSAKTGLGAAVFPNTPEARKLTPHLEPKEGSHSQGFFDEK